MTLHGAAAAVIAAHLGLAAFMAARLPLAPDETYYWEWSRNLALGYFDQGPGIAWWIRAFCTLFGDTPAGLRAGIIVAAGITDTFLYATAALVYSRRIALVALAMTAFTPLGLAGSVVATYDPLLAMFWSIALYAMARAVVLDDPRAWRWCGLAVGLGFLCKHTMALLIPCAGIALLGRSDLRQHLRAHSHRRHVWIALAIAVAVVIPNLWWQAHHDWITFRHLVHLSGKEGRGGPANRIGEYVGSQVALIGPLLFFGMMAAIRAGWRARHREDGLRDWLMFAASAPVLAFFLLLSTKARVQANWAATAWPAAGVLYAAWALESPKRRRYALIACGFTAILSALLVSPAIRLATGIRFPQRMDQMNKMFGGSELSEAVVRETARMQAETGQPVLPGAATYDTTSRLAFHLPGKPRTRCFFLSTRPNAYLMWNHLAPLKPGQPALIVDDRPPDDPLLLPFHRIFERVVPLEAPVKVYRKPLYPEPVHTYYLYRCYGYRPNPAVEVPDTY